MAVDILQERIRKVKNPSVLEFSVAVSGIPDHILKEEDNYQFIQFYPCFILIMKVT